MDKKKYIREAYANAMLNKPVEDLKGRALVKLYFYQKSNFSRYLSFFLYYIYIYIIVNTEKSSNPYKFSIGVAAVAGYLLFNSFLYRQIYLLNSKNKFK